MATAPDFIVIGAARAGTTALYSYLRQHPQIFMPDIKEPNFFAFEGETLDCRGPGADFINNSFTELDEYQALFSGSQPGEICGEASPLYLFSPKAPARIKHHVPGAKLIVILRNPVEQAFSHYLYATKQAIETEVDFNKALMLEDERMAAGWQPLFAYSKFPRYGEQLARFFDTFPRGQILIRTYEDFQQNPTDLMRDIFDFVGANPEFEPDMSKKMNAGGVPKNRTLQDFLMKPNPITRAIGKVVPQDIRLSIRDRIAAMNVTNEVAMPVKARVTLADRLRSDIDLLSKLTGRDYSHWLE